MKINMVNVNQTAPTHQHSTAKSNVVRTEKNIESNDPTIVEDEYLPSTAEGTNSPVVNKVSEEQQNELLDKAVEQANQSLKMYDRKLEMQVHEVTKTIMYTLRDTKTNEVIMEFPPKKIQDMIAKMWELAGLFVDKKA